MTHYQHKKIELFRLSKVPRTGAYNILGVPTLHCRAEYLQIGGKRKKVFPDERREGDERKESAPSDKGKKRILFTVI